MPDGSLARPTADWTSWDAWLKPWTAFAEALTNPERAETGDGEASTEPETAQSRSAMPHLDGHQVFDTSARFMRFLLEHGLPGANEVTTLQRATPLARASYGRFGHDSYAATAFGDVVDRALHAQAAHFTGGLSPTALALAYSDWWLHLALSPGKQLQLRSKALRKTIRLGQYAMRCALSPDAPAPCIEPLPQDRRFRSKGWQRWPFNFMSQAFLLNQQWWHNATSDVHGVNAKHEEMVTFTTRQFLDVFAPSNHPALNPDVLARTLETGGASLLQGWMNFIEDWERLAGSHPPVGAEAFKVGEDVAVTPGKVVYRNRLIELIQYTPTTKKVRPEPVLITPAWIMKYYVLDLSPENSLVRYLVDQGFTVFMISWKNPEPDDRDLGLEDYLRLGFGDALDAVNAIIPDQKVHAVGYCLGGTLLAIAAAAMRGQGGKRLASLSFFAAQADFTEAGELTLFINESQIGLLEDMMWEQGFLDTMQMAGAFQILRSNDLIFSRNLKTYLMGERDEMNDLMAWNSDGTRMPYKMHSDYLRRLFLNNDLAEGRLEVDGRPVSLVDVRLPIFALGTERDHIAPWRSAFKIHQLTDAEVTFALTNGGHNGGVLSEPGHPRRRFRMLTQGADDAHLDPESWLEQAEEASGSWWPAWVDWLTARSGDLAPLPPMGGEDEGYRPIADAPGQYVLQR